MGMLSQKPLGATSALFDMYWTQLSNMLYTMTFHTLLLGAFELEFIVILFASIVLNDDMRKRLTKVQDVCM